MRDITYCMNSDCPFKKCERHNVHLKKISDRRQMVSVADFGGTCKKYLRYLLELSENGKM